MNPIYFAYGSNMKTDRMIKRVPSARPLGYATLLDNKLVFNKISNDGSGKGNVVDANDSIVLGVLFEIDEQDVKKLDEFEKGYEKQDITVLGDDERQISAFTYVSKQTKNGLLPYDWYIELIIQGAAENRLPQDYIDSLKKFESKPDTRKKK